MANFIQRPRLFNPADAYQQGQMNRARVDTQQGANRLNAFNLQQEQQMAPVRNQAELVELKTNFQKLGAAEQKQALETANRVRSGIDAFIANPNPGEYQDFRARVTAISGDDADLPQAYDPAAIQLARQKLDWDLGAITEEDKDYGLNPVYGKDENGNLVIMQMDPSGGVRRSSMPSGVVPVEPQKYLNTGMGFQQVGTRTGVQGQNIPIEVAATEQQKGQGKGASEISMAAFKKLPMIQANINKLDRAMTAIDKGASTGYIQSMLPTFRAASVQLDQLQSELGLDVVGSVTFGALSEGELQLALDVALPTNLEPGPLREWIGEKRSAQQKLWNYLKEQATFLGKKGNTITDWYSKVDGPKEIRETEKAGGIVRGKREGRFIVEEVGP